MKTHADKSLYLSLLIGGLAIALSSTAGIVRVTGWSADSGGAADDVSALEKTGTATAMGEVRAALKCPECGFVVSKREIEEVGEGVAHGEAGATTPRRYEIIIRMADGSNRVILDTNPARWRTGERLVVIAGAGLSQP